MLYLGKESPRWSALMASKKPLDGKVALITGGSRGIGLAIARSLGRLGAKLSLCARHADKLETAAAELQSEGAKVLVTAADVTRASDIGKLLQKTEQSFGAIDVLVNNAGIGYFGPFQGAAEADWDAVLDTNLKSVFLLSKAVAPGMIERRAGHIINIASLGHLLRLKMGPAGADRMHGGGPAAIRHKSQRDLPGKRGDGFLTARGERCS
jgi:NAD(P)-dependent dehydrogenase (short-subunit alcohol dehydrogenase family)